MIESNHSLLPKFSPTEPLKVCIVGVEEESLKELERLLYTLDIKVVETVHAVVRTVHSGTYLGQGKLNEVKEKATDAGAQAIVIDLELTPTQLKNAEEILQLPTIDRPGVIIEIFSRHARTKEAKTQVEVARLKYLLPRLTHYWTHFERQRGGIGNKGMGETQVEVDRRLVKRRLMVLESRLKDIEKERTVQRASRKEVLKVALVGYTNAGKSTLLNAITKSEVLAQDKLFSTLDSCVRMLNPDSHPPIVAIDTVGFIRQIPTTLIASFRSTLEELHEADLLLHVIDSSSTNAREELETTEKVLEDLGLAETPRFVVLNKSDLLLTPQQLNEARVLSPGSIRVSALNKEDVTKLRDKIFEHFQKDLMQLDLLIPYEESKVESMLYEYGKVLKKNFTEKGVFYRLLMEESRFNQLNLQKYKI